MVGLKRKKKCVQLESILDREVDILRIFRVGYTFSRKGGVGGDSSGRNRSENRFVSDPRPRSRPKRNRTPIVLTC